MYQVQDLNGVNVGNRESGANATNMVHIVVNSGDENSGDGSSSRFNLHPSGVEPNVTPTLHSAPSIFNRRSLPSKNTKFSNSENMF